MTQRERRERNHPVRTLLNDAAWGFGPSTAELDAIGELAGDNVPGATYRREVSDACKQLMQIHATGEFGQARTRALDVGDRLVAKIGESMPEDPTMHPRRLAAIASGEYVNDDNDDDDDEGPRSLASKALGERE